MKKRRLWLIVAALLTVIVISLALLLEKVTIRAAEGAFIDQGWVAAFSSPLKVDEGETDALFITSSSGKKVSATITVDEEGRTIHVTGLEKGTYVLHVDKNLVVGKPFKALARNEIKFTIYETIESVRSAEELKNYFEKMKVREENSETMLFNSLSKESSSDSASGNIESEVADHSVTNAQVEGVDEADIVKTDGQYIYAILENGQITVTDIRNPKELKIVSTIKTSQEEYYPTQLFLHEDMLVILGDKYEQYETKANDKEDRMMPMNGMATVRLYDMSSPEKPQFIREIGTEGYLNGARKTGDLLYYVTNVHPNYWMMEDLDGAYLRPRVSDSNSGKEPIALDYKDIAILPGTMEPSYSVITAVDLSSPTESKVVTKGYLGGSEQLYMSPDNLYLTATTYEANRAEGSMETMIWDPGIGNSEIFKFALNGTAVSFDSSATLKGHLLNQFSMDEYNGNFRVVTTEGNMWDDKNPSKNHLFIMDEKMTVIGSVEGLAKGERIYSARFMGDKAYMVTFRETDPLFVIDVANPTAPEVLGELKIPGFSNYLHPLDENHLIGFGYETVAKKNPQGGEPIITTLGMKVSLFDVTDFNHPKEKDTAIIGGQGTYSQLQHDHKALFQHKALDLYGFPVMVYGEAANSKEHIEFKSSGALIYEITPEKGIVLKGDLLEENTQGDQYSDYGLEIKRMIYSGDELYTVSMNEINNYTLDTFLPISNILMK